MPPKKNNTAAAASALVPAAGNANGNDIGIPNGDADGGGKFQWEGQNDVKLLTLTQGRYVKPEEYDQLSSVFPGTTHGSIRNRISQLRVRQRNMYEAYGWELPEGGAARKPRGIGGGGGGGGAAKKRGAGTAGLNGGANTGAEDCVVSKKPRGKKSKKEVKEEVVSDVAEGEDEDVGRGEGEKGVKAEMEVEEV